MPSLGIVATFLLGIGASVIGQLLWSAGTQLFRGRSYQSVAVAGMWEFMDEPDGTPVGEAQITQLGARITAKVIRRISRNGNPVRREFIYKGTIYANQLLLSFNERSGGHLIAGNLVLSLSGNLQILQGYTTYFDLDQSSVVSHEIHFVRT